MPRRFSKLSELLDQTLGNPHKPMPTSSLTLPTVLTPTGGNMYLNPSFVEEMMGFPVGWTALKP